MKEIEYKIVDVVNRIKSAHKVKSTVVKETKSSFITITETKTKAEQKYDFLVKDKFGTIKLGMANGLTGTLYILIKAI